MLASITATFGLRVDTAFFTMLVSSMLAGAGGTLLGRSVLGAFLFLIPGAGPFLNGLVSGITAGLFTTAFGEAHIAAISHLVRDNADYHPTAEEIASDNLPNRNILRRTRKKITSKFAASALNVTLGLKLHQNLLQKFDGEILS